MGQLLLVVTNHEDRVVDQALLVAVVIKDADGGFSERWQVERKVV